MNVNVNDQVLRIDECRELSGATASALLDAIRSALNQCSVVEIDLSEILAIDCRGIGALISVRNLVRDRGRRLRLLSPSAVVERMFHVTRATHLLELVRLDNMAPLPSAADPGQPRFAAEIAPSSPKLA